MNVVHLHAQNVMRSVLMTGVNATNTGIRMCLAVRMHQQLTPHIGALLIS